ncbi:MAG: hypothetical protein ACREMZ_15745 [Gemmatimonadales bacterium]
MTPPLEQVLTDWRGEAQVLRSHGHKVQADSIEKLCEEVARAAQEFLEWVSEEDAMRRSRRGRGWLRSRFRDWERAGHARYRGRGKREYRLIVLPLGANESAAYEQGREAGRMAS